MGARRVRLRPFLHRVPQLEHQPRFKLQRVVLPCLVYLLYGGGEGIRIVG